MGRQITFAPGEFYHLYNRGVDKRKIFSTIADYERFLALLYICNGSNPVNLNEQGRSLFSILKNSAERGEPLMNICGYVLMPNHFHILAHESIEGGISKYMQKLGNAYIGYFNKRNRRSGTLFEGTFKARHASRDPYFSYILSYIHLNPVKLIEPKWKETGIANKSKAKNFLEGYKYSSYPDYAGQNRMEACIVNKSALPSHCTSAADFKEEVNLWLNYNAENWKV